MSDAVIISMVTGFVSLASLAMTLLIRQKQGEIHKQIDGMQDKLVNAEKSASKQEGNTEGRAVLKQEQQTDKK